MNLTRNAIILDKFYQAGTAIECSEAVAEAGYKQYERQLVRQKITEATGMDDGSMLGVTTDGVHVLIYAIATLYRAINTAESLDEIKQQTAQFSNYADDFMDRVESGELKLPYLTNEKKGGVAGVFNSVARAATGTSNVMSAVRHE